MAGLGKRETGIIVAADVGSLDELRSLTEAAAPFEEVVAIKVGFSLALRFGLPSVSETVKKVSPFPVIYDHQKAGTDIPRMGKAFAELCRDAGVDSVIFFPQAGPVTLEGFVTAAFDRQLVPIVGLVMTHKAYLVSEGGYISDDAPDAMCKDAIKLGVKSFVLPGTKTDIVSRYARNYLDSVDGATIMMPGIGLQGGTLAKAFAASKPNNRYAIIGSAIYSAPDPSEALASFAEELKNV